MGMFDTVYIKKALPLNKELKTIEDIKWDEADFQTKDLENALLTYEVTKAGKLRYQEVEREWVDDEGAFLKGYMKEVSTKWVDTKHTGKVRFYHNFSTNKTNRNIFSDTLEDEADLEGYDWWVEFEAEFVKGKLTDIKLIEASKEPAKFRILKNIEWAKELKKKEASLYRRTIKFLRKSKTYCNLIRELLKLNSTISSKISWVLYRL
jgi:hypothetical protein